MASTDSPLTPATDPPTTDYAPKPHPLVRVAPSWQAILVGLLLSVMLGVVAGVTAYVAQARSNAHTDRRLAELEQDLTQRRAVASAANARRDQQIADNRRIVCVVLNRIQPRDVEVEEVRTKFGCDQIPGPTPSGR